MTSLGGAAVFEGGRRRSRGLKAKTLRRMLKKKGLKTTGKKSTLMKRLHMRGGLQVTPGDESSEQGNTSAELALGKEAEFEPEGAAGASGTSGTSGAASMEEQGGKRRRRRSRRRREEEGGRRRPRHSRRQEKKEEPENLGY